MSECERAHVFVHVCLSMYTSFMEKQLLICVSYLNQLLFSTNSVG